MAFVSSARGCRGQNGRVEARINSSSESICARYPTQLIVSGVEVLVLDLLVIAKPQRLGDGDLKDSAGISSCLATLSL